MKPVLECNGLSKSFGGLKALEGFSMRIENRTSAGLVGANGAGKTTLFSLFCGFLKPSSGTLNILGLAPDSSGIKGRISILPQDAPMLRGITVYEQLKMFAQLQGYNKKSTRLEIDRLISLLNIDKLTRQFPETLSYGQRKKVTLAQALIGKPEIILLDEPTSGLDPVAANEVRKIIQQNRNDHTFIVSSHNLEEIKTVCDEIIIIDKGKLVRHCQINELIGQNNVLTLLLDRQPGASVLDTLASFSSISNIVTDQNNNKRITIFFQDENPDQVQFRILECLQKNGAGIIEFNRGTAFADRVVELVSKQ